MGGSQKPVFLDADAVIYLLGWGYWGKLCKALGDKACLAQYVATQEVRYYKDRFTNRRRRFASAQLNATTVPRVISPNDLTDAQHDLYLEYIARLTDADLGERETFALAWILGYDVCSIDVNARDVFRRHKPADCDSAHMDLMTLLRRLGLISS